MARLLDVAQRAGVSKTLVSRLINGQSGVSQASREKIERAMRELDYVPNAVARSLAFQKTETLAVVLDDLCEPYFFDMIRGIESAVYESQYDVIFCSSNNDLASKERRIRKLSEGRADGVIIYGSSIKDEELIRRMSRRPYPFVIVENEAEIPNINSIILDNRRGAEMAVDHLVKTGCKKIWHFSGDMDKNVSISRIEGFLSGMKKNHLAADAQSIVQSDFTVKSGYLQMKQFLQAKTALPDGIFFGGDSTAYGAMMALRESGISVPEQIQIIGFDNDMANKPDQSLCDLTTLSQPLFDMGKGAVKALVSALENPEKPKETQVFVPELLLRDSTLAVNPDAY